MINLSDFVHYVLPSESPNAGAHRNAVIVRDYPGRTAVVNLQVFTDGEADGYPEPGVAHVCEVPYAMYQSAGRVLDHVGGTWHHPGECYSLRQTGRLLP